MLSLTDLLQQSSALHKHLCPRQVLGVRMGLAAADLLGLDLPQSGKGLFALVETDGCFADGVSVASGCWLGHRTLRLVDYGKVAVTFVDLERERAIRLWPHPVARERAHDYEPNAQSHWHAQLAAYQKMPVEVLLCWAEVKVTLPLQAIISKSSIRTTCARCGEEILNEREVIVDGQTLCRACAVEPYYVLQQPCAQTGTLTAHR